MVIFLYTHDSANMSNYSRNWWSLLVTIVYLEGIQCRASQRWNCFFEIIVVEYTRDIDRGSLLGIGEVLLV